MELKEMYKNHILEILKTENISDYALKEEFFDHLCSVVEEKYKGQIDFRTFIKSEINSMAPQGLKLLELQTNFASNSKSYIIMKKFIYVFGLLSSILLAVGVLFKLMSWPRANMALFIGVLALFLVFVPYITISRLGSKKLKSSLDKWRTILGLCSSVLIATSVIFKALHLMGANVIFIVGMAVFIIGFIPVQFIMLYKQNTLKPKKV